MLTIADEDWNDRCEALLDKLYQTYHAYHYNVGVIDIKSFQTKYEARQRRKEIRLKELKLWGKHGRK